MLSSHGASELTLNAQIKLVTALEMSHETPLKSGPDRRKRKRGMFSVPVQIRGGVGTLEVFEDLVTSLDVSRDGLLLSTSRGGYSVGQRLHVSCPYWRAPTAINIPRNAQVIRNVLLPNYTYALALQFMPGICEESSWNNSASPFPNQVRVLCVESDSTAARALCRHPFPGWRKARERQWNSNRRKARAPDSGTAKPNYSTNSPRKFPA